MEPLPGPHPRTQTRSPLTTQHSARGLCLSPHSSAPLTLGDSGKGDSPAPLQQFGSIVCAVCGGETECIQSVPLNLLHQLQLLPHQRGDSPHSKSQSKRPGRQVAVLAFCPSYTALDPSGFLRVVGVQEDTPMLPFQAVPQHAPWLKAPPTRCSTSGPFPRPGSRAGLWCSSRQGTCALDCIVHKGSSEPHII